MEYRRLGKSSLDVSRVGFGCWAIGGHGYGLLDDATSISAIKKALDLGINFFDTADVYGFGHSEEVLGRALGRHKRDVVIATKFGVSWDARGRTRKDCSPKRAREAVDASLARLGLDSIPLYQVHWHDGCTPIPAIMETLDELRKEGKIRHIGCSNFSLQMIEEANEPKDRLVSAQLSYGLLDTSREDIVKECGHMALGTLVYGVLGRGLLGGKYGPGAAFGDCDTRSKDPYFRKDAVGQGETIVELLKEVGARHGRTAAQVATRWVLESEGITVAIVGAKNEGQVEENAGAASWYLDDADYKAIALAARIMMEQHGGVMVGEEGAADGV